MIVNIRLEVTDEQRNALSRRLNPRAMKRLASRPEVTAFVLAAVAGLDFCPLPKGIDSPEICDPGPNAEVDAVDNSPVSVDNPEKAIERHETGVSDSAPNDPLLAAIYRANNAMFSVSRIAMPDIVEAEAALNAIYGLRDRLIGDLVKRG